MRSEHVLTNVTCNQNCPFCTSRAPAEDPFFVRLAAVRARVDAALRGEAREIVLTGGEPTLRRDLPAIVRYARGRGAERVVLETNGTLVDDAKARDLALARLDLARVHLSGASAAIDRVTHDEGGFERTLAGIRSLLAAGVPVEVSTAVVRSTRDGLAALPAFLASAFGPRAIRALVLSVPVESPDPSELLAFDEAGLTVAAVAEAARPLALEVRLSQAAPLPPCVLPERTRHAHLFALSRGGGGRQGHRQVEACATCQVADRCPGLPEASLSRFGVPPMRPVADDRLRRRLSLVGGVEQQIARELVTPNRRKIADGPVVEERVVRVNFHCNQACRFCFVSTHLPPAQGQAIREAIIDAGRAGARVTLSGGEPTLNAELTDYVRLARASSPHPVELQTNATRLDDALVARLVEAGLGELFVSLHGACAELSDAITQAPGTFVKTVAGLDALARSPLRVTLNFVICRRNFDNLPAFVRWAHARWPAAHVNVSFVAASTDVVPRDRDLVPSYSEVMPRLAEAFAVAEELGLRLEGLEAMCGVPLCLVPSGLDRCFDLATVPDGFDAGEFIKTDTCATCALKDRCFGLRRGYAELYGDAELRAVATPAA